MTDILWYTTEENVNWGEWREIERLPLRLRIARWFQKRRGFRYVVGASWPSRWSGPFENTGPAVVPLVEAAFGPVAPAQQVVIAALRNRGGIPGGVVILGVAHAYDDAKLGVLKQIDRTKPEYEVSSARPMAGGFEAIYTPID